MQVISTSPVVGYYHGFSFSLLMIMLLFFQLQERHHLYECFHLLFRKGRGDQNVLLAFAVFQVPLAQNNPYMEVAYFDMTCSANLQCKIIVLCELLWYIILIKYYKKQENISWQLQMTHSICFYAFCKKRIREYYEQLYTHKLNKLDEMDQ